MIEWILHSYAETLCVDKLNLFFGNKSYLYNTQYERYIENYLIIMKQIPQNIMEPYDALLLRKQITRSSLQNYRKWLRYYLDFCDKYKFNQIEKTSPPSFLKKLIEKKQSEKIWGQG